MKKFVLRYVDEVVYEVEAEDIEDAMDIADEWWAERTPTVNDITDKEQNNDEPDICGE